MNRRRAALLFLAAANLTPTLRAQQPPQPAFEVASIKPAPDSELDRGIRNTPGGLRATGCTLRELILFALDAHDFQLTGGPAWLDTARFDITATNDRAEDFDASLKDAEAAAKRIRARLRHLLEDRFRLQLREEQREVPIYALTVEKSGPKLKPAAEPRGNINTNSGAGGGSLRTEGTTLLQLCETLSGILERPVIDQTGIQGAFDVNLKYSLDIATPNSGRNPYANFPTIFTAIKEQLGLRPNATKGPARAWVILAAEKPTDN
jgi:uncharacterized protein (TIGR03435 family)